MSRLRRGVVIALAVSLTCLGGLSGRLAPTYASTGAARTHAATATANPWARRIWGYLPAPGGVELRYSVLLPRAHGRFPVLMQYDGYDAGEIGGVAYQQGATWMSSELDASLLRRGYAVMGLQMPGTGCSSGTFDLFAEDWGTDGALGVEWAARQPWSTGRVGMYDWSWPGIGQLFTASTRPKALDAIAPGMVVTDPLRDVGAPGGIPNPEFNNLWWATILDSWTYAALDAVGDGDTRCAVDLARNVTVGQATSPTADSTHLFEDGFWRNRDLRAMTRRIAVPVLSMVDWQDEEVGSRGGYYQQLLDPSRTWYVGTNGQHDIYLSKSFRPTLLAFMDHFVKQEANGFARTPHVRLWEETTAAGGAQSSDDQLTEAKPGFVITRPRLPVPVHPTTLWLRTGGGLAAQRATAASGSETFAPLPGPIVNNDVPGAILDASGGPVGELPWQASAIVAGTALSFTTPRLTRTITLSGPASLNLWLSSTATNTDVQVTVTEVRPGGQEEYVQRGWLRVSARAIDKALSSRLLPVHQETMAALQPLTPGRLVRARVEIPNFTHTFRAGTAIRIWLDAPSGTGDWNFLSSDAGEIDTLSLDHSHDSALVVGRLSGHRAPGHEPACDRLVGEPCRANPVTTTADRAALPRGW
ncbi:MAG TPA: CocE/NonD family hydrolase [Mycobacteriales bacterium]|nr:CocE/NonD family hydrolase [Mycobacteriales bacterium]